MKGRRFRIYEVINDGKTTGYNIDSPDTGAIYPVYSVAIENLHIPLIPYTTEWMVRTYLDLYDNEYNITEILVYEEIVYEQ
jgi:hypothetical protein